MKRKNILAAILIASAISVEAKIELPDIVGPDMVVQQNSAARLWGWATPGSKISVTGSWNPDKSVTTTTPKSGKWIVELPTPAASFDTHTINIKGDGSDISLPNVAVGEVWLCSGQSNMEMPLRGFGIQPIEGAQQAIAYSGKYPFIRVAKVPKSKAYTPQEKVVSPWKVSKPENAGEFTALGYFFARSLQDILNVPVGIIDVSYGGSKVEGWQSREQLANYPEWDVDKEMNDTTLQDYERINIMYNSMLHPLIGYTIKGFLWNQGESNCGRHDTYPYHQKDMVTDWREKWGLGELPFYFVEMPPWSYGDPDGTHAAIFRESQHKAAEITPSSEIVCTSDLVYPFEVNDVHARKKKEIGERLAFMAADKTYGIKGMPTTYPKFKEMEVDGNKAILTFTPTWEGFTPNGELEGFEAAGADRIFHPAKAVVNWDNNKVELSCPEVDKIESVRYNFRNFSIGKVWNMTGLPLVPFRTDNWEK